MDSRFAASKPENLPVGLYPRSEGRANYDLTPDGGKFLIVASPADAENGPQAPARISVVLNWFTGLRRLAPGFH